MMENFFVFKLQSYRSRCTVNRQFNSTEKMFYYHYSITVPARIEGLILFMRTFSYLITNRYSWSGSFCNFRNRKSHKISQPLKINAHFNYSFRIFENFFDLNLNLKFWKSYKISHSKSK